VFFFSSRRRHTRWPRDWSSDVCTSDLALAVAAALPDVEIVSLDSMQVYRGMDIGTAKPSPVEQAAVRHHLVDVADPAEEWSMRRSEERRVGKECRARWWPER